MMLLSLLAAMNSGYGQVGNTVKQSHPATNTPEYINSLKTKAELKRARKAIKKLRI